MRPKVKVDGVPSSLNEKSSQEQPLSPSQRAWYEKRKTRAAKNPQSQAYQLADTALLEDNLTKKKGLHLKPLLPKTEEVSQTSPEERDVPGFSLKEELEKFFNIGEFEKTIRDTKDLQLLRLADEFSKTLREIVQNKIKQDLWGDEAPEGTVSFKPFVQDESRVYLKASVRGSSRLVGVVEGEEKEKVIREHQQRKFQTAIEAEQRSKKIPRK